MTQHGESPLLVSGILSGEVTSDPFEGWTTLAFRLDLELRGELRGEVTVANLQLPVRSWRQLADTVVTDGPDSPDSPDSPGAVVAFVQLGDEAWLADMEYLELKPAERGDASLTMRLELRDAVDRARRIVFDGDLQVGVIRVSGGHRTLVAVAALLDLEDFEPAIDADTDTFVLHPRDRP